jgi:hypothetical protein
MGRRKIELTAHYLAAHSDGERAIIDCYTTFTEYVPLSGASQWLPGSKSLKMQNSGNHVNAIGADEFEDVVTGRTYRRIKG